MLLGEIGASYESRVEQAPPARGWTDADKPANYHNEHCGA